MKIFIIILMFIATIYSISNLTDNSNIAKIGEIEIYPKLKILAIIGITIITVVYNLVCVWLLLRVL